MIIISPITNDMLNSHTVVRNIGLLLMVVAGSIIGARSAKAQLLRDPNAIDLSPYLRSYDTSIQQRLMGPFNIGDVNGDGADDVLSGHQITDSNSQSIENLEVLSITTTGSSKLSDLKLQGEPRLVADLNGDGIRDLITLDRIGTNYQSRVHWGVGASPYFPEHGTTLLADPAGNSAVATVAGDINGDGIDDVILTNSQKGVIYFGAKDAAAQAFMAPVDSIQLTEEPYYYNLGIWLAHLSTSRYPTLVTAASGWIEGPQRTAIFRVRTQRNPYDQGFGRFWNSWDAPPVDIYYDTAQNVDLFVYTPPSLVYDLTGDGFDDLLVSDSSSIYVFNGSTSLILGHLKKSDAFKVIPTRRITYPGRFLGLGDINGSGIPYVGIGVQTEDPAIHMWTYLYAGGGALDGRYDGWIDRDIYSSALLHLRKSSSRTSLAFAGYRDNEQFGEILDSGVEKLPHEARLSVSKNQIPVINFPVSWSNGSMQFVSPFEGICVVEIVDILGIVKRTSHIFCKSGEYMRLDVPPLANGVYHLVIRNVQSGNTSASKVFKVD